MRGYDSKAGGDRENKSIALKSNNESQKVVRVDMETVTPYKTQLQYHKLVWIHLASDS